MNLVYGEHVANTKCEPVIGWVWGLCLQRGMCASLMNLFFWWPAICVSIMYFVIMFLANDDVPMGLITWNKGDWLIDWLYGVRRQKQCQIRLTLFLREMSSYLVGVQDTSFQYIIDISGRGDRFGVVIYQWLVCSPGTVGDLESIS